MSDPFIVKETSINDLLIARVFLRFFDEAKKKWGGLGESFEVEVVQFNPSEGGIYEVTFHPTSCAVGVLGRVMLHAVVVEFQPWVSK